MEFHLNRSPLICVLIYLLIQKIVVRHLLTLQNKTTFRLISDYFGIVSSERSEFHFSRKTVGISY